MRSAIPEALLKNKKMLHTKAQQPFCLERHEEKKKKWTTTNEEAQ